MIKRISRSLSARVFVLTAMILVVCCSLTYGFIAWLVPRTYTADLNEALSGKVAGMIGELQSLPMRESGTVFDQFQLNNEVKWELTDSSGTVVPIPSHANPQQAEDEFMSATENITGDSYGEAQKFYLTFADSTERYILTVSGSVLAVNQVIRTLGDIYPWLTLVIFVISAGAAWIYSCVVTRPVIQLSGISRNMSELNLDWHCDESRTDELGVLARSLNRMAQSLSAALADLQNANALLRNDIAREKELEQARVFFFSAVSHELKTPITIIKGQLEGMLLNIGDYKDRDKYLARSLEVASRLENMVQEIVTVTRTGSAGLALHKEAFRFDALVKRQLAAVEDLFCHKKLTLDQDIQAPAD